MNVIASHKRGVRFAVVLLIMSLVCIYKSYAQDPHLSQYFAHPLYVNPAFAGAEECPRISLAYRNQWPNISGGFSTMSVSYDQHINAIKGGIGAYVMADIQGGGVYRNIMAAFTYSYKFRLGNKFSLRLAAEAAYVNRYANWNTLTFPDQFDPMLGLVRPETSEEIAATPLDKSYADFSVGALAYNDYFYVGLSVSHLNRPDMGYTGIQRLAMKYIAHIGGRIYFKETYGERRDKKDMSISPNLIFIQQGKMEELSYGLYMNVYPMVVGLWYRHNFTNSDAMTALLGFEHKGIRIAYSYDISLSKLKKSGGAHEISIGFRLPCPNRVRSGRIQSVPCPSF